MTTTEPGQQPQNSQPKFEGKVAIVTGAASGIGRATALLFAARGAQVIGEDINPAVKELSAAMNSYRLLLAMLRVKIPPSVSLPWRSNDSEGSTSS